jgi:hypothetical protein
LDDRKNLKGGDKDEVSEKETTEVSTGSDSEESTAE